MHAMPLSALCRAMAPMLPACGWPRGQLLAGASLLILVSRRGCDAQGAGQCADDNAAAIAATRYDCAYLAASEYCQQLEAAGVVSMCGCACDVGPSICADDESATADLHDMSCADLVSYGWCASGSGYEDIVTRRCPLSCGTCSGSADGGGAGGAEGAEGGIQSGDGPGNTCKPVTVLTDRGAVDDGEGRYADGTDCRWSLRCSDRSRVPALTFSRFETESNFDFVTVYDGDDTGAPQMARLSGVQLPPVQVATGPEMVVQMTSDGSVGRDGFEGGVHLPPQGRQPPPDPSP
eukprot:SAG22_NODE_3801_length_1526_cov_1.814296_2_plen_292_part_00